MTDSLQMLRDAGWDADVATDDPLVYVATRGNPTPNPDPDVPSDYALTYVADENVAAFLEAQK